MQIALRPTASADLEFVLTAEADLDAERWIMADAREVHAAVIDGPHQEHLVIVGAETQLVGFIMLAGLDNVNAALEVRRIVVTRRGEGIGRAALRLAVERCLAVHNARRVWLDVSPDNERAKRSYRAVGFVYEGTLRDAVRVTPDTWEPLEIMSVLSTEWANPPS